MDRKTNELMTQVEKIPHWEKLPRREISWDQAVSMMMSNNIDLLSAENSLKTTQRSVSKVFTQMIPGVNLDWMLTKELSDLARVGSDDVEYNTNILFNMPSLTQIPIEYYSAKASVYSAEKNLEMKKRELISRLYRQVLAYQDAQITRRNQLDSLPFDDMEVQRMKSDQEWENKMNDISQQFAMLMGNMEARWLVSPASMPRVNWEKYKIASKQLDVLVVTLAAMQLEASRLQIMRVKMNFFPSLDINFYSPSLFSSSGGTYSGFFAGGGDLKVNMSLTEELDTRLNNWYQYKSAKENHDLLQKRLLMDLQQRRIKIAALLESRRQFELWRSVVQREIQFRKSQTVNSGDAYLEQRKELKALYEKLDAEMTKNEEVEAALIMEYGWLK